LVENQATSPQCHGLAHRLLYDLGRLDTVALEQSLSRVVSVGQNSYQAALWLDGFLQGSALLIIHHPPFFEILNTWVNQIPEESFQEMLPIMRRAFAAFSGPERHQIQLMVRAKKDKQIEPLITQQEVAISTIEQEQVIQENYDWLFGDD
jgi:Family of unknown function (DUF5682)